MVYAECVEEYWPAYFFYNWYEPEHWVLYEAEEGERVLAWMEGRVAWYEEHANSGSESADVFAALLSLERQQLLLAQELADQL